MIDLRTKGVVTSPYGDRVLKGKPDNHYGIDIVLKGTTDIPAVLGGEVLKVGYDNSRGNYITIKQTDSTIATYMHMKFMSTWKVGDIIDEGAKVGTMGNTGNSTGPHVHYELRTSDNYYIDPDVYFEKYANGSTDPVGEYISEVIKPTGNMYSLDPNKGESEYSLLGNIVKFVVIFLVALASIYLILKSFDIKIEV